MITVALVVMFYLCSKRQRWKLWRCRSWISRCWKIVIKMINFRMYHRTCCKQNCKWRVSVEWRKTYKLAVNSGPDTLHGGINGFNPEIFNFMRFLEDGIRFIYLSQIWKKDFQKSLFLKIVYRLSLK